MNKFKIYFLFLVIIAANFSLTETLATCLSKPYDITKAMTHAWRRQMASRLLFKKPINNNFSRFYSTKINKPNAYKTFGISENLKISKQDLNKLYRDLVKRYHPDRNTELSSEANNKFLEVKEAYEYIKKNHPNFKHANQFKEEDLKLLQKLILEEYLKWKEEIEFNQYKKSKSENTSTSEFYNRSNQHYNTNSYSQNNIHNNSYFQRSIVSQEFKNFIKSPLFITCSCIIAITLGMGIEELFKIMVCVMTGIILPSFILVVLCDAPPCTPALILILITEAIVTYELYRTMY